MGKQYAIIGMGRFGSSIANRLYEAGNEVLGIDRDEVRIEESRDFVTHAVIADTTEENALREIGIRNFDVVVVSIGNDIQASILTTLLLKELGVKHIVAKALNKYHGKVLSKIGADKVVYPERDMGERVAHSLMSPNVLNFIEVSKDYSIEEIKVPSRLAGKSLRELDIRARYHLSVIAIRTREEISVNPSPDQIIKENDVLLMIGENACLKQFADGKEPAKV
ncbi:potassium channel family protein [Brevibacillus panacihumi]|uniref:potassium channel family protein n=1 Tax=Brevibacillus panacihumi TaxID=497735 RepID=UPI003D072D98